MKSSTVLANQTARLMSDSIYQEEPVCLTFWYHMNGRNPGTLNVYVKNMGEKKGPVWTKSGDQGLAWRYAEIEIAKPEKGNKVGLSWIMDWFSDPDSTSFNCVYKRLDIM